MNRISSNKLLIYVLIAVVLGILFGLFLPALMLALAFLGDLFVNILQIVFIPLVASAIITGVSAFANYRQTARAALATLSFFIGTTVVAILIGLVLSLIIKPGAGVNTGAGYIPGEITTAPVSQSGDFLGELAPANIINAIIHGKYLGWMIVLTILAAVLGSLGQKAKPVTDFFETIYAVVQKVLGVLVRIAPVGIFFVIGAVVARNLGFLGNLTGSLGKFSLVLFVGFLLQAVIVIPAFLKFYGQRSPFEYFTNVLPALKTTLATASPTAALPITFENSVERNKIDNRVAAMVLPIGSSINVNGRALYVTVCALFIAQAFGLSLGFTGTLYVALAAMFFSMGTVTVPFAAMLTLVAVFDASGFPSAAYAGIGLVFVLDWFWGRIFAALDVWSCTAVAAVVEESVVTEIARPQPPEREPARRFERGRPRRDFRDSRERPERKGDDRRPERPERSHRPHSRPEREPIPPQRPAPRPETFRDRPARPIRPTPSPFELKADSLKTFNTETAKTAEPVIPKAPLPKKDESDSQQDERRKLREKKNFPHGHDVGEREPEVRRRPPIVRAEAKPPEIIKAPPVPLAPPPLIREIEMPKEVVSESFGSNETPEIEEPGGSETDEMQTSLFGRAPHRKGFRPKSDEPPKPVEEAENYSTEKQEFGRRIKKKKNT